MTQFASGGNRTQKHLTSLTAFLPPNYAPEKEEANNGRRLLAEEAKTTVSKFKVTATLLR